MLEFIDYSEAYYAQIEKTIVPQIREGKFVQIADGNQEYLVFAPKGLCKYHSHIVERFAELRGLSLSRDRSGETVGIDDPDWRILGGGRMRIDQVDKRAVLEGSSQAYGPFRRTGLTEKISALAEFGSFTVSLAD